jgi:hypothetical protein
MNAIKECVRRPRFYVYPDGLILPIIQGGGGTSLTQSGFRGRNDDVTLTTNTWTHALNTNWTQNVDTNFRVRFSVLCEGMAASITPQLQYDLNNSGTWNNVTGTSSVVRASLSTLFNDDAGTTQLISGGTFIAGRADENDGTTAGITFTTVPQVTEVEFCVQIRSADVADGNTVQLRVVNTATALNTYSFSPSITVNIPAASLDQVAYRGYADDAGLGSATAKAAQNTNWNQPMEENFRVRFEIQEEAAEAETIGFQLQYNRNSAGWNNVHALSLVVRTSLSSNVADGAATGDLLTAGTGTFRAGTFDEVNGQVATVDFQGSDHTEVEFCVKIRSDDVAVNDTIQLRVIRIGGSLETWTATPTVTATAVDLSFAWVDAMHPPENSHIPPIKVGSDYYAIAIDSTATSHFGVFKTTTPGTPASWTWVAGGFAPDTIGAIAWELISTTIHIVTKDGGNAGFVNYWAFAPSGDSLGTREEVTSAPQDATGPTLAAVSFAFLDEPHAGYSANWSGSLTAFEWKHRDTPVGGQWLGFEDFISDTSGTALAGRLISAGATMYAFWVDSDIEAGNRVAWASTDNLFDWTAPAALTAVPSTAALHVLSNAVIFGTEDDVGVAYLDSSDQLSFVGLGTGPELITTSTPMISSATLSVSLVVDASGNVHALIVLADGSVQYAIRTAADDTWSSLTEVLAASASADNIHAAWIGTLIAYVYDDGTGPIYGEYTPTTGGTVNLTPATLALSGVALDPDPGLVSTNLAPAIVALSAVALDPTPPPITVNLTPAVVALSAQILDPQPQPVDVNLAPANAVLSATALDPAPGVVTVGLTPAVVVLSSASLDPTPTAVAVDLSPATAPLIAQVLDAQPGVVSVSLTPATLGLQAMPLSIAGGIAVDPAIISISAVALDPQPGLVTTQLTPAAIVLGAVALDAQTWKPQNLIATAVSDDQIDLTWDVFTGAIGYDIERDTLVIVSDHPTNSYSDTGLDPSTLYTYRVRAVIG